MFEPFIINSNICTTIDEISTYDKFMECCAGNIGNMYITYSLAKELGINIHKVKQIKNIYTYSFDNFEEDIGNVSDCTHTILVLQDQIRKNLSYRYRMNYEGIIKLIDYINRPLLIIGIGANCLTGYDFDFYKELDPDLIWFLRELSNRCGEIGVRGEFTEYILNKLGIYNTCIIGCPSYYEQGENRQIVKEKIESIEDILISGSFYEYNYRTNIGCHEILQDQCGEKYIKLIAFDELNDHLDEDEKLKYIHKQYCIFSDIESWKSTIKKHRFVIGYRFHGTVISLNSGIPAICCNNDSRAVEMCNYFKIPHIRQIIWSENSLYDYYNQLDLDKVNRYYNSLFSHYCDFIYRNIGMTEDVIKNNIRDTHFEQPRLELYKDYCRIKGQLLS